jgi:hypothetical protein
VHGAQQRALQDLEAVVERDLIAPIDGPDGARASLQAVLKMVSRPLLRQLVAIDLTVGKELHLRDARRAMPPDELKQIAALTKIVVDLSKGISTCMPSLSRRRGRRGLRRVSPISVLSRLSCAN